MWTPGITTLQERRLGRQDHVGIAADVGDRVRRRQPHPVARMASAPRAAGPARIARIGRPRHGEARADGSTGSSSPTPRRRPIPQLRRRASSGRPRCPRLGVKEQLPHHRDERCVAGSRRDENVGPVVVRTEDELALRTDHPHPVADRQFPQQRRERSAMPAARRTRSRPSRPPSEVTRPSTATGRIARRPRPRSSCTGRVRTASVPPRTAPRSRPTSWSLPRCRTRQALADRRLGIDDPRWHHGFGRPRMVPGLWVDRANDPPGDQGFRDRERAVGCRNGSTSGWIQPPR